MRRALPAILFAALVAAVYADPLFFSRNFTGRDLIAYNIPMEKSVHSAWSSGELPVWTPEISGGRPLAPNPNIGSFYPVRILLSRIPFPLALRVYPVLHWIAAGVGMLLLLSSLGLTPLGAWIGAVTYVFSGVSVSECFYTHIQPGMALLPWILWQVRRGRGRRGVVGLGLLFALDMLAGDVFTIALAIVCAALWIALEEEPAGAPRALGRLGAGIALGVLAAAPQIVATALWIPETNRGVTGMKVSSAILYSVSPWRLLELVVPFPFGPMWRLDASELWGGPIFRYRGMGLFETLYVGALAVMAVAALRRRRRPGLRFARVLLVIAVAACVLPSLLPESWGRLSSPLPLRNPEKFAVAIAFALALFAARGFDFFREERRRPRGALAVGALLAALAAAAALRPDAAGRLAAWAIGGPLRFPDRAALGLAFALAVAGLLWMATAIALELSCGGRRSAIAGAALLTLVPLAANRPIAWTEQTTNILDPTPFAMRLAKWDPRNEYRVLGGEIYRAPNAPPGLQYGNAWESAREQWIHYTHLIWGRGTVFNNDFDSGDLSRVESLRQVSGMAAGYRDAGPFFGAFSLRWCVRNPLQDALPGYRRIGGTVAQDWDELTGAYPDIRLATSWKSEASAVDALHDLPSLAPGELAIETGERGAGTAPPGRVTIVAKTAAHLVLETESAKPSWLFVLRAFWNHRTVEVDGRPTETAPANLAFTAVPVPAGRHRVTWRERVPGGDVSRFGPILFGIIAAAAFVKRGEPKKSS